MYSGIVLVLALLAGVVLLAMIAPRLHLPFPILLVFGGLIIALIPGLPRIELEPDLVFLLFLPPLIYSSAWTTSWRDFRRNLRPILLLAIGLVLLTTTVVGFVAYTFIPGFTVASAFVLGAIVSPPDAVAASAITQQLGLPRRIITVLEGESLVNDATALVALQFALTAVSTGTFSPLEAGWQFLLVSIGGIVLGVIFGWLVMLLHHRLDNAVLEISITLLTPYAVYLLAEEIHVSGVIAVVATGLFLTWRSSDLFSSNTRLQSYSVWEIVIFLINGLVFILIGLQFPRILEELGDQSRTMTLLSYAALVSLTVIVIRIFWVFPATYVPRLLSARIRERDPYPGWRNVVVISWTGLRGVVSLAAALSLPTTIANGRLFPGRDLIVFLTFSVILVTLVGQGLSLPLIIRRLGLKQDDTERREELQARLLTAQAALKRIDDLATGGHVEQEMADHLRSHYVVRLQSIQVDADSEEQVEVDYSKQSTYRHIQSEVLQAENRELLRLRNTGVINDEVMHILQQEIDLDEQRLKSRRA